MRSLTTRLMLAMTAVAVVTALLGGLLTAPLLASAAREAVREPVGQQADLLSRLPAPVLGSGRGPMLAGAGDDVAVGMVDSGGTPSGVAASLADAELAALARGEDVSTTVRFEGERMIAEARPRRDGGAVVVARDVRVADAVRTNVVRRVVLGIGGGLVVAVAVAWLIAARLSRPLRETAAAARRMTAGERGVTLPASSTAEVADVSSALGGLDRALVTSEGRQREFLMSVSHELRTPLTAIRGYAEGLADGVVDPGEARAVGRTLVSETQRLERYVADLLALSRLEADDFALHPAPVDVAELVATAADAWRDRIDRAGLSLEVDATPSPLTTDGARLRQVLDVLLDNAVRVLPEGGQVVVAVSPAPAGGRVHLEVRDSGPGLSPEDAAVAFVPGALHERHPDRAGGAGLGLAIAHRLVARLGGSLSVSTAAEGGAAFVVDLPEG